MTTPVPAQRPRLNRIIRRHQLPQFTGLGRSKIAELIEAGNFAKPVTLVEGGRAVGFFEDDLIAWQQKLRAATDAGKTNTQGQADGQRLLAGRQRKRAKAGA